MSSYKLLSAGALLGAALFMSACSNGESGASANAAPPDETPVERGRYLVTIMGCTDCHTPGHLKGQPDMSRFLAGSDVGFEIPGLGVYYGSNLTPDTETGLGAWTEEEIVTVLTTGERPDGRILAGVMPWRGLAHMKPEDAKAVAAFLKSLPPVRNRTPGPYGQSETPDAEFLRIVNPAAAGQ